MQYLAWGERTNEGRTKHTNNELCVVFQIIFSTFVSRQNAQIAFTLFLNNIAYTVINNIFKKFKTSIRFTTNDFKKFHMKRVSDS